MNESVYIYPVHQVSLQGSSVTITCKSQTRPLWEKDGIPLIINYTWCLVLSNITDKDAGTYYCKGQRNSEPFTVESTVLVADYDIVFPHKKVDVEDKSELFCGFHDVSWYYEPKHQFPVSLPLSFGNMFVIPSTKYCHSGIYYCFGALDQNREKMGLIKIELRVYDQSRIVPENLTILQGDVAKFTCKSETMVMWLDKSDTVIGNGPQILIKIHPREKKKFNREIECLSRDSTGHQFRAIGYLNVIATSIQRIFPPRQVAVIGRSVKYVCHSLTAVRWKFNNKNIPTNAHYFRRDNNKHTLIIKNLKLQNSGIYTCQGKYGDNLFESSAILTVLVKCPLLSFENGKYLQMSTYVGTISEDECEFDPKVFEDPKPECIREGVWTRDKKC